MRLQNVFVQIAKMYFYELTELYVWIVKFICLNLKMKVGQDGSVEWVLLDGCKQYLTKLYCSNGSCICPN